MPASGPLPISFRNDASSTATAHGCLMVTGVATVAGVPVITVDQPDGTDGATYLINSDKSVPSGDYGECYSAFESVVWADYNDADTPAAGEEWGPATGSWEIAEANTGFRIIGGAASGIVLVTSVGGGVCPSQNEIQRVSLVGSPTGGTFNLVVTLNGTPASISIAYDDTANEVETALEGHSEGSPGDFTCTNGPLPDSPVDVEFTGTYAATSITLMGYSDVASLTGGSGVGCIIQRIQSGR